MSSPLDCSCIVYDVVSAFSPLNETRVNRCALEKKYMQISGRQKHHHPRVTYDEEINRILSISNYKTVYLFSIHNFHYKKNYVFRKVKTSYNLK
jgi:hypothetical protein